MTHELKEEIIQLIKDVNNFMFDVIEHDVPNNDRAMELCFDIVKFNIRANALLDKSQEGTL